jgi:hypothetical protein
VKTNEEQKKELINRLENKMAEYIQNFGVLKEPLDCLILSHELLTEVILSDKAVVFLNKDQSSVEMYDVSEEPIASLTEEVVKRDLYNGGWRKILQ